MAHRRSLLENARKESDAKKRQEGVEAASRLAATSLPDLVIADAGAIAIRREETDGTTWYDFYRAKQSSASIVALASRVLGRVGREVSMESGEDAQEKAQGVKTAFKTLTDHLDAGIEKTADTPLNVTDDPPKVSQGE